MANMVKPDYNNCILNIISSILKYFKVDSSYSTIDILDNALKNHYKNIILMVFDGMGIDMLQRMLSNNSFLRSNIRQQVTSVYPCTTTAAMTAFYSGLSPNEHGWLGWSLYFKEYSRCIDTFTNQDSFTKTSAGEKHAAYTLMPYKTVYEKINEVTDGNVKTYTIMPSGIIFPEHPNTNIKVDNTDQICKQIERLSCKSGGKFIMSYWYEPDTTMHELGCYVEKVKSQIEVLNRQIEEMCSKLNDSLVIITADHGLINITEEVFVNNISEIDECLIMPPTIESRAVSFFVKDEMKNVFKERFSKQFGDCFVLYTKDEVMKSGLLGNGQTHKKVFDFVGDYLACAIGSVMIRYKTLNTGEKHPYMGQHAGLTAEEMFVPLIMVEKS